MQATAAAAAERKGFLSFLAVLLLPVGVHPPISGTGRSYSDYGNREKAAAQAKRES